MTCIGNSGPLPTSVDDAIKEVKKLLCFELDFTYRLIQNKKSNLHYARDITSKRVTSGGAISAT